MDWLNYHHLFYFWTVAREGTIAKACQRLQVAQPTISAQLRQLERAFGQRLFEKSGRTLQLTDAGRVTFQYAEEIFTLGRELADTMHGRPSGAPLRFVVGVADVMPKLIARRLLEPALRMGTSLRLVCRQGTLDRLVSELAQHTIDLVISDTPFPPALKVRAYNHLLAESTISWFAAPELAAELQQSWPGSLDGAAVLLPSRQSTLRRLLDQWFESHGLHPQVHGEFDDSALLKAFGEDGLGAFPAPTAIATEICRQHRVLAIGTAEGLRSQYFAISVERKLKHPAVVAISDAGRELSAGLEQQQLQPRR